MDTAERLIESTRELLWERGYVGTSPKAILERASAGQGSMYHHFRGKADLAQAAIERTAQELQTEVAKQFDRPGTPEELLSEYLLRERDVLRGCPIGRLTHDPDVMASAELRRPVEDTMRWLQASLTDVLTEWRAGGTLDPAVDPAETATMIVAVMQGGYVLARAARDPRQFDQAVRGALNLLRTARAEGRADSPAEGG